MRIDAMGTVTGQSWWTCDMLEMLIVKLINASLQSNISTPRLFILYCLQYAFLHFLMTKYVVIIIALASDLIFGAIIFLTVLLGLVSLPRTTLQHQSLDRLQWKMFPSPVGWVWSADENWLKKQCLAILTLHASPGHFKQRKKCNEKIYLRNSCRSNNQWNSTEVWQNDVFQRT